MSQLKRALAISHLQPVDLKEARDLGVMFPHAKLIDKVSGSLNQEKDAKNKKQDKADSKQYILNSVYSILSVSKYRSFGS
jgi:hypothetical protein